MFIQLNSQTIEKLEKSLGERPGYFKLFFDTEGCGCNGVIVIQVISEPHATDIEIQKEPFTFLLTGNRSLYLMNRCDLKQMRITRHSD